MLRLLLAQELTPTFVPGTLRQCWHGASVHCPLLDCALSNKGKEGSAKEKLLLSLEREQKGKRSAVRKSQMKSRKHLSAWNALRLVPGTSQLVWRQENISDEGMAGIAQDLILNCRLGRCFWPPNLNEAGGAALPAPRKRSALSATILQLPRPPAKALDSFITALSLML